MVQLMVRRHAALVTWMPDVIRLAKVRPLRADLKPDCRAWEWLVIRPKSGSPSEAQLRRTRGDHISCDYCSVDMSRGVGV